MIGRVALAAIVCASLATAAFAETVRIGILAPMSGANAQVGKDWQGGIGAYQAIHGMSIAGHEVEVIYRDIPELDPGTLKARAQELVIKNRVQYLGGVFFTPEAMAVAEIAQEAKVPTVTMNAATSSVLNASEYMLRSSYTLAQVSVPAARYALGAGIRKVVTLVADFAPGLDSEQTFARVFKEGGGTIVSQIRMPLRTTDFGPFLQTALNAKPDALFIFTAGGQSTFAFIKAYNENGLRQAGIRLIGTGDTPEVSFPLLGDAALGIETAFIYAPRHDSAVNAAFIRSLAKVAPDAIAANTSVFAYDAMAMFYRMIEATKGKADGAAAIAAIKGHAWESPRGPVSVDAKTRAFVQNVYIRIVEKDAAGTLYNKEIVTLYAQPDFGLPAAK